MVTSGRAECNVLLTSAGRRVALTRCFQRALQRLGVDGQVVCVDLQKSASALHVADAFELVPKVMAPGYLDALREICIRHKIRMLVPLIDTELPLLASHREAFEAIGVRVLVSSPEVTAIGHDKRKARDFFVSIGQDTPRILESQAELDAARFPLFLKPSNGSSSIGARRVDDEAALAFYLERTANAIVQECIAGEEFTLDVLADFDGKVRCVVPRLRIETRAGEVSKGVTVKDAALIACGRRVVEALPGPVGCITLQCFREASGRLVCTEINARFGGGFPLAAEAGADFPGWLIGWTLGRTPDVAMDGWQDGLAMLRFDDAVFLRREEMA